MYILTSVIFFLLFNSCWAMDLHIDMPINMTNAEMSEIDFSPIKRVSTDEIIDEMISDVVSRFVSFGINNDDRQVVDCARECLNEILEKGARKAVFELAIELKYQVILAIFVAIKISYTHEDLYYAYKKPLIINERFKFEIPTDYIWVVRLFDCLSWVDFILYNLYSSTDDLAEYMKFFVRVAYEISWVLLPLFRIETVLNGKEIDLHVSLTNSYKKWNPECINTSLGDMRCFEDITVHDGTLYSMLHINKKLFNRLFIDMPVLASYPLLPLDYAVLVPEKPHLLWHCVYVRERIINQLFEHGFFQHINKEAFQKVFEYMQLAHSYETAEDTKQHVLEQLRNMVYRPFEQGTVKVKHKIKPKSEMEN